MGGREGKGNFYYLDNLFKKKINLFLATLGLAVCMCVGVVVEESKQARIVNCLGRCCPE